MEEKFTHKVDPRSIHADQRKIDSRRDAWDRDYMPADWVKPEPKVINVWKMQSQFLCLLFSIFV